MNSDQTVAVGSKVTMTKGYRGAKGLVAYPTDSRFDLYVISLDTGMKIVAGPSAFVVEKESAADLR
ncbi:MAG: hypothetical protein R6X07_15265 [Desulfatiglandales bacterium]